MLLDILVDTPLSLPLQRTHARAYVLVVVKGNIYTRKPCRGTTGKAQPEKLEWPWIKDNTIHLQLWMPNENLMSQFGNTFP